MEVFIKNIEFLINFFIEVLIMEKNIFIHFGKQMSASPFSVIHHPSPKAYLIFFHGNASSIDQEYPYWAQISSNLQVTVFLIEYLGYYVAKNLPETNIIDEIMEDARKNYNNTKQYMKHKLPIIFVGQSIGSAVAIHLAATIGCDHLILITPIAELNSSSYMAIYQNNMRWQLFGIFDPLVYIGTLFIPTYFSKNIDRIQTMKCNISMLSAENDTILPYELHGKRLMELNKNIYSKLVLGNHNIKFEEIEKFLKKVII